MKETGTNYFEGKPMEKAVSILQAAARKSIALLDEQKARQAQLTLQCALDDVDDLLFGKKTSLTIR